MCVQAVVYESATGFTYRYAYTLADMTGIRCCSLKEAQTQLSPQGRIVYLGWVRASLIQGLKQAQRQFDVCAAAAVGMYKESPAVIRELSRANDVADIPFFYLRGGVSVQRTRGLDRLVLRAMALLTARIAKKDASPVKRQIAQELTDALHNGADYYDSQSLLPLAAWIRTHE